MKPTSRKIFLDQPAGYQIKLLGRLGPEWATTFDNFRLQVDETADGQAITTMVGMVSDQAALHGLLNQVRDLGLVLVLLEYVEDEK